MGGSGERFRPLSDVVGATGGGRVERDCSEIRFSTTLQQPVDSPVHQLEAVFELVRVPSGDVIVLAAVDDDGEVVGTVIEELADLLRCTEQGFAYVAEVTSVEYERIHRVAVRPASLDVALGLTYQIDRGSWDGVASSGPLRLYPTVDDVRAEVVVNDAFVMHSAICELRSLLRVEVPLQASVNADGAVTVARP